MSPHTQPTHGQRLTNAILARDWLLALVLVAIVVVVGVAFGWENNKLIPVNPAATAHYQAEPSNPLSFLANWDGRNYLDISRHGYQGSIQTNFFPLYPLLIRAVTVVVRSPLLAGLFVSWASLWGAVYFFLRIIKQLYERTDNLETLRAALLFVLFPTGVFLLAVYTESLFAFLAFAAAHLALRRRWFTAGVCSALATATHVNGIFLVALVMLLLWEQRQAWWRIIAAGALGALGILSYMAFLLVEFHDPIAFVHSQKVNGWLNYGHSGLLAELVTRKLIFVALLAVAAIYWWRKRRSFALYSLMYVAIVFLGGLGAFGRYALAAFPIPLMFYDYFRKRPLGYSLILATSVATWMYFLLQFAGGYSGG